MLSTDLRIKFSLNESLRYLFYLIIFTFCIFPSSTLVFFKLILILLNCILLSLLITYSKIRINFLLIIYTTFFILIILNYVFFTITFTSYNVYSVFFASFSYLTVFLLTIIFIINLKVTNIDINQMTRFFVFSCFIYSLIKIFILCLPITLGFSFSMVKNLIANTFFMSAASEDSLFIRIATSNDYLVVFSFLFILLDKKFGFKVNAYTKVLMLFTMFIVLFLTFTRYIWVLTTIIIILKLLKTRSFLFYVSFTIMILSSFFIFPIYSEAINKLLFRKLDTKFEQTVLLFDQFTEYPFWGSGIGAYLQNYTRNTSLFLYENQFLSLFMQLGIIGGLFLFSFFIFPFCKIFLYPSKIFKFSSCNLLVIIYVLFLFSSLTNPNLFLLNMSLLYFILYFYTNNYVKN